jgi:phosphoribosylformimino-5-aminoimidazole carboxamide ribotide isomerase
MAAGPDLGLLERLVRPGISVIASGGVRSASDLLAIRALGCAGAILGRALYDGSLAMEDALAAVTDRPMAG